MGKSLKQYKKPVAMQNDYLKSTRVVLCVTATERKVTHRYKLS